MKATIDKLKSTLYAKQSADFMIDGLESTVYKKEDQWHLVVINHGLEIWKRDKVLSKLLSWMCNRKFNITNIR